MAKLVLFEPVRRRYSIKTLWQRNTLAVSSLARCITSALIPVMVMCADLLPAQEIPQIHSLRTSGYRTERQCWSVTENCEGYLFVATASGIQIYNGFQWETVKLPLNRVPRSVYLGRDCRVYTGGFETFGYIDYGRDRAPRYVPVGDSIMSGSNEEMWKIFGNNDQMVVQSFADVYIFDYTQLRLLPVQTNVMYGEVINGNFYIPQIGTGIYQVRHDSLFEVHRIEHDNGRIRVAGLCPSDDPQEYIVATEKNGFFRATTDGITRIASTELDRISNDQVNRIIRLTSGGYVIGTILNGIYITDDLEHVKHHINKTNGLSDNTVLALYEDARGDVWVGLDIGLDRISMTSPVLRYYDRSGVLGTIYATAEYADDLYMATNHGLFKRTEAGDFALVEQTQGQAWCLGVYQGTLLCGHNVGTFGIDSGGLTQLTGFTGGCWMHAIDSNSILQASYTGLVRLDYSNQNWNSFRIPGSTVPIRKFVLGDSTVLGYHQRYGLCIVQLSSRLDRIHNVVYVSHLDDKVIPPYVGLFRASNQPLVCLDNACYIVSGTALTPLDEAQLSQLRTDSLFSKALAAYHALLAKGEYFALENLDHMRLAQTESFISSRDDGYEIVGIGSGPHNLSVEIDHWRLHDQKLDVSGLQDLKPAQRSMTVQLCNLSEKPHPGPLWYQLTAEDSTWRQVPGSGELALHNLNHGDHTLKVKDAYGHEKILATFSIPQFWYLSWPGGILYMLCAGFILWAWNRRVKRKMIRESQRMLAAKEKQLESERMRSNNERLQREILLKSKMLANRAMSLVQKNKLLGQMKDLVQSEHTNTRTYDHVRARIIHMVDQHTNHEDDWEVFQNNFDEVHEQFTERLLEAHPELTSGDKRLAAFIRMDLSSKEIAPLLNISVRSVENKRHRLRKKLRLSFGDSLRDYLMRL